MSTDETNVALKEHLEVQLKLLDQHQKERIQWLDRFFESRIHAIKAEIEKAESTLTLRLHAINEAKETLLQHATTLASKDALESHAKTLDDKIRALEMTGAALAGRAASTAILWASIVSVLVGVFTALAIHLIVK